MKVQISFKVINPEFDQEYSDQYKGGEESDSNYKYSSERSFEVKAAKSVEYIKTGVFKSDGKLEDGSNIDFSIPNVSIFRCHLEDGTSIDFAASKSVLHQTHQAEREKYDVTRCYFYINPEPASIPLTDQLFINLTEIPEALLIKQ